MHEPDLWKDKGLFPGSWEQRGERGEKKKQKTQWKYVWKMLPETSFPVIARARFESQRAWTWVFIWAPGWPEGQLGSYQGLEALISERFSKTRWLLIPVTILNHETGYLIDFFKKDLKFSPLLYELDCNCCASMLSSTQLCDPMACSLPDVSVRGIFQAKNTGVGCCAYLQS